MFLKTINLLKILHPKYVLKDAKLGVELRSPEEKRAARREAVRKWQKKNPGVVKKHQRNWREKNRESIREYQRKRHAIKKANRKENLS